MAAAIAFVPTGLQADAAKVRGGSGLAGVYAGKVTTPLALNWRYTANVAPFNPSAPAVSGTSVFFASGTRIYCVDAATGSLKWRFPQDEPLRDGVVTTPAVSEGTVYVGGTDGKLYALNAATGRLEWQFDTRSVIGSSPAVVDGIVYFGSADGKLWALDTKTRDMVAGWKGGVPTSDELTGAPAVANGFVYALSLDQTLHAFGVATGKERWRYRLQSNVVRQSPVVSGEYVYVANGTNLDCIMGRSGATRWRQSLPTEISTSPAATEDTVYVVTGESQIYAFETRTGRPRWKNIPKLDYEVIAPPSIVGDTIILGTVQGGVYAVDTQTGAVKWSYKVVPSSSVLDMVPESANVSASPVVANDTLYILTDDGSLSAFRSDAVDGTAPIISDVEPEMGLVVNGTPPFFFEAKVVDEGSGINPESVRIAVDGEVAPRLPKETEVGEKTGFKFDVRRSLLEYHILGASQASTVRPMAEGRHTVTITAADWKGNVATKSWAFTVDNSTNRRQIRKRDLQTLRNNNQGGQAGPGRGGQSGPGSGSSSRGRPGGGGRPGGQP
jgi:outer membrane protein assembly factor BamB